VMAVMRSLVVGLSLLAGAQGAIELSYPLPTLPYNYTALEPIIDEETMILHHAKHTQAYTDGLNEALEGLRMAASPLLQSETVEQLVSQYALAPLEVQTPLRNMGGGYVNHIFFFDGMRPMIVDNHPSMSGAVLPAAIEFAFGSFDEFKVAFATGAKKVFGSGWEWLLVEPSDGSLSLASTPNQDTVLPSFEGKVPIMNLDVWEHAYYKTYGPDRLKYIDNWFKVVDWDVVTKRYLDALMPDVSIEHLLPAKPLQGPTTVTVTTTTVIGGGIKEALSPQ